MNLLGVEAGVQTSTHSTTDGRERMITHNTEAHRDILQSMGDNIFPQHTPHSMHNTENIL